MKNKLLGIIAITAIITLGMAACASLTIVSVDWDSLEGPSRTRQYIGVSSSEVNVYANYKDESRKKVTFLTVSHDKDRTGNQTVTVSVIGGPGTGTFQTEVMELLSIRVDRAPSKTSYTVGERADLTGIKVMGSWRDLPDAEISSFQVTVASFDSSSAGNKVVTVDFKGKRATFNVTVTVPATPAPAASQPSQPAQQQPSTQQPAQPAPSTSTFNPAPNQPAPTGTWRGNYPGGYVLYTFNANGTGRFKAVLNSGDRAPDISLTWTASGNRLTITFNYGEWSQNMQPFTSNCLYSISGNTLTWQNEGQTATETLTRQ